MCPSDLGRGLARVTYSIAAIEVAKDRVLGVEDVNKSGQIKSFVSIVPLSRKPSHNVSRDCPGGHKTLSGHGLKRLHEL